MIPRRQTHEKKHVAVARKTRSARSRNSKRRAPLKGSQYEEALERLQLIRGWIAAFAALIGLVFLFLQFLDSAL